LAYVPDTSADPSDEPENDSLLPDARRALVQLVKGPYLTRERNPNLWVALENSEAGIRAGLDNLFLELVLDREQGLAFVRNIRDEDAPKVIRAMRLTLIDTALVLFLRERLLHASDRAFIGRDEIDDQLQVYGPASGTDPVTMNSRINSSVEKMKKNSILQAMDEEGRFEISPVLRMVFDADEVAAVSDEVRALIASGGTVANGDDGVDEEES
ncbi:MAG: DUF4194 domain-containing protein, partial [Propionibacteriaceae bacterium]|nr:DUF4194 domain-containing protein [Propionibacteriaceae bacterium]